MTTYETTPITFNNKYYENYPVIQETNGVNVYDKENIHWIETIILHNTYLESLGADFDGDTVSLRSVYTQEANKEAERIINSPAYFLNVSGKNTRVLRNEGVQTLFTLTRD